MNSDYYLNMKGIQCQIDLCKNEIEFLLDHKPLFFQKKKLEDWKQKLKKLENELSDLYHEQAIEYKYYI